MYILTPRPQSSLTLLSVTPHPLNILEIGTFRGATTLKLAKKYPQATIFTVNPRPEEVPSIKGNRKIDETKIGEFFTNTPYEKRIVQIRKRSQHLTLEDLQHKTFQLIYIDGAHDYYSVMQDTELSLSLLDESGIIVWDDTCQTADPDHYTYPVTRAVIDSASKFQLQIFHCEKYSYYIK